MDGSTIINAALATAALGRPLPSPERDKLEMLAVKAGLALEIALEDVRKAMADWTVPVVAFQTHGRAPGFLAGDKSTYAVGGDYFLTALHNAECARAKLDRFIELHKQVDDAARALSIKERQEKIFGKAE